MNQKLFDRIKKIAKSEGRVVIVEESGDDAFVLEPLNEDLDAEEINPFKLNESFFVPDVVSADHSHDGISEEIKLDSLMADQIKKDAEEWRAGGEAEKTPFSVIEEPSEEEKEAIVKDSLTEEDRYYLEPLE